MQIVKKLVEIEKLQVSIIGCAIIREKSGLAMSSRNKRLSNDQLKEAPLIYKTLSEVQEKFNALSISELNDLVENKFAKNSLLELEYFEIADEKTLKTATVKRKNINYRAFIGIKRYMLLLDTYIYIVDYILLYRLKDIYEYEVSI